MHTGLRGALAKLGWAGLYRGALISQIDSAPTNLIYLGSTEYSREKTRTVLFDRYPNISEEIVTPIQSVTSAVVANFLCMIPSYPVNLVIAKMVIQSRDQRLGFLDLSRQIYKRHGWAGFSHGFGSKFTS
jgi:ABC-type spermidine/putrescine transport system permease subunit I